MVEFIDDDLDVARKKLKDLESLIKLDNQNNDFAAYEDLNDQKAVFEIRKAGLNILMSMKGDRKGVAFIEDCAVTLENLSRLYRTIKGCV